MGGIPMGLHGRSGVAYYVPGVPRRSTARVSLKFNMRRSRWKYALATLTVILTGLFWRSRWCPFSPFLIKYGGDALWALMVFLGFGILFVRASVARVALFALSFSAGIEFSQLYHAPWID